MIYSLLVLSSPTAGHGVRHAAEFARAVLDRGHTVHRVFFLDEGVHSGAAGAISLQDEDSSLERWVQLAQTHSLELILCVSSALRRGILDDNEAQRHDQRGATMHPAFTISGLGQLVEACAESDRVVTFGG